MLPSVTKLKHRNKKTPTVLTVRKYLEYFNFLFPPNKVSLLPAERLLSVVGEIVVNTDENVGVHCSLCDFMQNEKWNEKMGIVLTGERVKVWGVVVMSCPRGEAGQAVTLRP